MTSIDDIFDLVKEAELDDAVTEPLVLSTHKPIRANRSSSDSGERALAGIAAATGSITGLILPGLTSFATGKLSELGQVKMPMPATTWLDSPPVTPRVNLFGEIPIKGRELTRARAAVPAFQARDRAARKSFDAMSSVVDSFITDHKLDRKIDISFKRGPLNRRPSFDPIRNRVSLPRMSKATVLHELGHAADYNAKKFGRGRRVAGKIIKDMTLLSLPLAFIAGDEIARAIPGSIDDKVISFMQNNAPEIAAATLAATHLVPEIQASRIAYKHVLKTEGPKAAKAVGKKLLLAFSSHMTSVIPTVVGLALARKYMRESPEKSVEKTAGVFTKVLDDMYQSMDDLSHVSKAVFSGSKKLLKDPKRLQRVGRAAKAVGTSPDFAVGAISTGIPVGLGALYIHGRESGRIINERTPLKYKNKMPYEKARGAKSGMKVMGMEGDEIRRSNPLVFAGVAALGAALVGGITRKFIQDLRPLL
jgi:hypothetical protein